MAQKNGKASKAKRSNRSRPKFAARARLTPDGDWVTIGQAWSHEQSYTHEQAYEVRLHSVPINWDGSFLLMPIPEK